MTWAFVIGGLLFNLWWPVAAKVIFGLSARTRNWLFVVAAGIYVFSLLEFFGYLDRLLPQDSN